MIRDPLAELRAYQDAKAQAERDLFWSDDTEERVAMAELEAVEALVTRLEEREKAHGA